MGLLTGLTLGKDPLYWHRLPHFYSFLCHVSLQHVGICWHLTHLAYSNQLLLRHHLLHHLKHQCNHLRLNLHHLSCPLHLWRMSPTHLWGLCGMILLLKFVMLLVLVVNLMMFQTRLYRNLTRRCSFLWLHWALP